MLKFYDVDKSYIEFLKTTEAKIPNISYDTHDKFICGVVLRINGKKYYAPISSFNKPQRTNILLKNNKGRVTSSIRLSFMFPVPDSALSEKDFSKENLKYRRLLMEEYQYCNKHELQIIDKAQYIYQKVVCDADPLMVKNCCNFEKLENAYEQYIIQNQCAESQQTEDEEYEYEYDEEEDDWEQEL